MIGVTAFRSPILCTLDQFRDVFEFHFLLDPCPERFDGLRADLYRLGDPFRGFALRHQPEHFQLVVPQAFD